MRMAKRRGPLKLGVGRPPLFPEEPKQRVLLSIRPEMAQHFVDFGDGSLSHGIELAIEKADAKKLRQNDADDADPRRQKFNLTLRPSTVETLKFIGVDKASRGAEVLADALKRKLIR